VSTVCALWQRQAQHAVLQLRHGSLVIDFGGQREAARNTAVVGLADDGAAVLLLFALLDLGGIET
jgi:hypothetical protein